MTAGTGEPVAAGFTAIVLAGDRGPDDPLLKDSGVGCKAMIEIDGEPMVLRVLGALSRSHQVAHRLLSGPASACVEKSPALSRMIAASEIDWLEPQPSPSSSAYAAMTRADDRYPTLITTADHPLLTPEIVDRFCAESRAHAADVTVGLCRYELIVADFPDIRKTVLKFRDGNYCGCNLFAFLTPASRRLADSWRQVESQRKNPLRVIRLLGWVAVLRYLSGTLSLQAALELLSRKLNLRIRAVELPFAEAAVDVDSIADRVLVQQRLAKNKQ